MAHALSITDGTTTISLSTTNWFLRHYVPNAPTYRNGVYDPVTDSIDLLTDCASAALAQAAINAVEKLLEAARQQQETKRGPKVYLQLQLDSDAATWRSRMRFGTITLGNDSLRAWQGKIPCTLVVEREPFWDGALTQLVNAAGLANSISNNTYYTATAVAGVMPTPAHIELKNASGSAQTMRAVWFGINSDNAPATWSGTLSAKSYSFTAPRSASSYVAQWSLTNAEIAAMKGDYFRFVAAFTGGATWYVHYQMKNIYASTRTLSRTALRYANPNVDTTAALDFGTMAVPAGRYSVNMSDVDLDLGVETETVDGSDDVAMVQIYPADNVRRYDVDYQIANNGALVDDNIEEDAYISSGSVTFPDVHAGGPPLMLYPGRAHRFLWLATNTAGYTASLTANLSVWYRPRRVTL